MPKVKVRGKYYSVCGYLDKSHIIRQDYAKKTAWHRKFEMSCEGIKIRMLIERSQRKRTNNRELYKHNRSKKHKVDGPCAVCGDIAKCKHHITPLDCGGSNRRENLINICHKCHILIHPWMIPETPDYIKEMDNNFRNTI